MTKIGFRYRTTPNRKICPVKNQFFRDIGLMYPEPNLIIRCALNSYGHRHETLFLDWLGNYISELDYELRNGRIPEAWKAEDWRKGLAELDPRIDQLLIKQLDDWMCEDFIHQAELIASIGYDFYGPAHSGCNGIYEFCGVYKLQGSDYSEGPSVTYEEFFEYLDFHNDSEGFEIFISPHIVIK